MKKITIQFFASVRLSFCGSLVLLLIAASSCHKDDVKKEKICYLSKVIANSKVATTASFSSDNKLQSISNYDNLGIISNTVEYEYGAVGKPSKVSTKNASGTVESYQTFQDNVSGLTAKITYYSRNNQGEYPADFTLTYEYDGDKKLIKSSSYYIINSQPVLNYYITFEYNSSGEIIKRNNFSGTPATLNSSLEYEYDDKKSYLTSMNLLKLYPEAISSHNVKKVTFKDQKGVVQSESYTNTYTYNEDGYPIKLTATKIDGTVSQDIVEFEYNCK